MEEALIEVPTRRRFAVIEPIFETVKAHLSEKGMTIRQGTIIDATLIAAPSSTKNKEGKSDPEMHQTKKGNQW